MKNILPSTAISTSSLNLSLGLFLSLSLGLTLALTGCQGMSANSTSAQKTPQQASQKAMILQEEIDLAKPNLTTKTTSKKAMTLSEQLEQYNWQLKNAVDSSKKTINVLTSNPRPVTLSFGTDKVEGKESRSVGFSVGCNNMGAGYQLNTDELSLGNIMSTQMLCQDMSSAESMLATFMSQKSKLSLQDNTLVQTTADGSTLTWQGSLKNSVKYGKGQTIFLEVLGKTKPCSSGANNQCLQVRDVYYNKKGIQTGKGKWRLMNKAIKGYKHDANTNQILRLKKYVTDPVDIKGKQVVYVFDMAVETEFLQ